MKLTSWILSTIALITAFIVAARGPQIFGITFATGAALEPKPAASLTAPVPPAAEVQVTIDNFAFAPATITIPAGTYIRWLNKDDTVHTVVSEDKSVRSKALDTNEEFTYTFTKPGTYSYLCSIHPKMTGKVIVE